MKQLLRAERIAEVWDVAPSLLRSPSWRRRHGLRAVRIGRLLRFEPDVIAEFCDRRREGPGGSRRRRGRVCGSRGDQTVRD